MLICVAIVPRRVPKSERPPVRSPSAYILFFSRLAKSRKGEIKPGMMGIQDLSKEAAAIWNNMTIAEKKVIYIAMFLTCRAKMARHSLTTTRSRS